MLDIIDQEIKQFTHMGKKIYISDDTMCHEMIGYYFIDMGASQHARYTLKVAEHKVINVWYHEDHHRSVTYGLELKDDIVFIKSSIILRAGGDNPAFFL